MIIDYDHNPALTTDQKLQSLKESVQMALNELEANNAPEQKNSLAKMIIESYSGSTLAGSAQSVKSAIDELDSAVDAIADYIVEQGTSGIWTYRKWISGVAECWGTIDAGTPSMTNAEGYGYYATRSYYNFPSGLFSEVPRVTYGTMMSGAIGNFNLASVTSSTFDGFWWCTRSTSVYPCQLQIHAKGRWK